MPKRKNNAWTRNKKEKQIITARLIEISLRIDDYIYKHQPISDSEAEQFIREVVSYKPLCNRDERCLQVIEKLTRCMKAVMIDHRELKGENNKCKENNDCNIINVDNRAGSISPVYSISDEDKSLLTQRAEELSKSVTIDNKDVMIIDLCNSDDDEDIVHNECTKNATGHERDDVEVEIHKTISNLSLRDAENPLGKTSNETNNSQSILNTFEGTERIEPSKTSHISQGAISGKISINNATSKVQAFSTAVIPNIQGLLQVTSTDTNSQSILNNFEEFKQISQHNINTPSHRISAVELSDKINSTTGLQTNTTVVKIPSTNNFQNKIQENVIGIQIEPIKTIISVPKIATNVSVTKTENTKDKTTLIKKPILIANTASFTRPNDSNPKGNTNAYQTFYQANNNTTESQRENRSQKTLKINDCSLQINDPTKQPAFINKDLNQIQSLIVKNVPNMNLDPKNTFHEVVKENKTNEINPAKAYDTNFNNINSLNNNQTVINENSLVPKKKRAPRKKKTTEVKDMKPRTKTIYRPPKKVKENILENKIVPIYNKNVENDLSWLEDIRYVREIRVDEQDPKFNLEESFWNNYYLPANWDDNEFL